jgi:hypothetical protein
MTIKHVIAYAIIVAAICAAAAWRVAVIRRRRIQNARYARIDLFRKQRG